MICSDSEEAKNFTLKAVHNLAKCQLATNPRDDLLTLGLAHEWKDEPEPGTLSLKAKSMFLLGDVQDALVCLNELLKMTPLPPCDVHVDTLETILSSALRLKHQDVANKLLICYQGLRQRHTDLDRGKVSLSWMKVVEHEALSTHAASVAQELGNELVGGEHKLKPKQQRAYIEIIMRLLSKAQQGGRWDEIVQLVGGSVTDIFKDDRKCYGEIKRILVQAHLQLGNLEEAPKHGQEGVETYRSSAVAYSHYEAVIRQSQASMDDVAASIDLIISSRDFHVECLAAAAAESMKLGRKTCASYCLESIVAQAGSMLEDGVDDVAVKLHPVFLSGVLRSLLMNKVSLRHEVVLSDGRGVWQFTIHISCIC